MSAPAAAYTWELSAEPSSALAGPANGYSGSCHSESSCQRECRKQTCVHTFLPSRSAGKTLCWGCWMAKSGPQNSWTEALSDGQLMQLLPLVKRLRPAVKRLLQPALFTTVPEAWEGVPRALGAEMAATLVCEPALANGASGAAGRDRTPKQVRTMDPYTICHCIKQ